MYYIYYMYYTFFIILLYLTYNYSSKILHYCSTENNHPAHVTLSNKTVWKVFGFLKKNT